MRKIDTIVIHCSATPEGRAVSVSTIRNWHLKRGWRDIGYHYVIGLNGEIWPGRPVSQKGAHVRGHNTGSIGICYVGGVTNDGLLAPKDTRTPAQKSAIAALIRGLLTDFPQINRICGHRDFPKVAKACPCFDAIPEYEPLLSPVPIPGPKPDVKIQPDPMSTPDRKCEPAFVPDRIFDQDVYVPKQLDNPAVKKPEFWERLLQVVTGGGLTFMAPYLQDWRIIAGVGGTVVLLALIGSFTNWRALRVVKKIRDAAA